ncbi:MAG: M13 family metallopeptidase [Candidatus Odinarchaeota archaeon]
MIVEKFAVDSSIRPQDDFYLYVNKKWKDANPIPEDQVSWGSFNILNEKTQKQVKELLEGDYRDPEYKKLTRFYRSGLNIEKLDKEGYQPVLPYLEMVDKLPSRQEIPVTIAKLYELGLVSLFTLSSDPDAKNTSIEIPYLITSGLGLPDREYYFQEDKKEIKDKYTVYIENMFKLIGEPEEKARSNASKIVSIETQLAEVTPTNVEKRDPDKYYNRKTVEELEEIAQNFAWKDYFSTLVQTDITYLSIDKAEFYSRLDKLLFETIDLETWKIFLKFKIMSRAAPYLSSKFEEEHFNFYARVLSGQKTMKPRWRRVVAVLNQYNKIIGELVGKLYVEKHFPPSSKEKMLELITNLQEALKERILDLDWMSTETKEKAILKHGVFKAKIGYPDKWTDFSSFKIGEDSSYLENVIRANEFDFKEEMKRLYKLPDPGRWYMHPQTINAYFHPMKNEIVFPAAILQFPFFHPEASEAVNYGGIGAVIGHELTHSYDDQGRKFDHNGELNNWWNDSDLARFSEKAKYYEEEYSSFQINGKNINGKLTLGENLSDHGGVKIAYHALQKCFEKRGRPNGKGNFTPEQEFFLSWARVWRSNIRPEEAKRRLQTDPHSPDYWRGNGTVANIEEFHQAFDVKPGDKLYRENVVNIW